MKASAWLHTTFPLNAEKWPTVDTVLDSKFYRLSGYFGFARSVFLQGMDISFHGHPARSSVSAQSVLSWPFAYVIFHRQFTILTALNERHPKHGLFLNAAVNT